MAPLPPTRRPFAKVHEPPAAPSNSSACLLSPGLKMQVFETHEVREYKPLKTKKYLILEAIAGILGLASTLAFFIYIAYFFLPGPFQLIGTGIGIWLCVFNIFLAGLAFYQSRKPIDDVVYWYWAQMFFFTFVLVTGLMISFCYAVDNRVEGYAWAAVLVAISSVNMIILTFRFRESNSDFRPKVRGLLNGRCKCLQVWLIVNYGFLLLFLALIVNGALTEGQARLYKPRGIFTTVTLPDGNQQRIHYLCEGQKSNAPVIVIDADGSHGMSDFWGMQSALVGSGRRVCVFDKPGLGWSDYWFVSQNLNSSTFMHSFLTGIGEKSPFILVGWGGGAENIWPYANEHPEMVSAIVWMDAYSSGIEHRELQYSNNWTDSQTMARRQLDYIGRTNIFYIIRGLGSIWGLMPIFIPYNPTGYEPADRYDEYRWYYLTDKTWTTQFWFLKNQFNSPVGVNNHGMFDWRNPALNVPIHHLMTYQNDTVVCSNARAAPDSAECQKAIKTYNFMKADQFFMANLTGQASYSFCTEPSCSQSFPVNKPRWAAEEIIKRFPM